jgi:hypothetical protein
MTNGSISISPSSTFLTMYIVAISQIRLHMCLHVYLAADSVCRSLFDIRSIYKSRQSIDKQFNVTGVSTSRLQAAFRNFYDRYNHLVCQYNFPLNQMLPNVFHTNREAILHTLILTTVRTIDLNWN